MPAKTISCPKCNAAMTKISLAGVEVDKCTTCSGIWCDMLEQEDLKKADGAKTLDAGTEAQASKRASPVNCPVCHTRMSPIHDLQQPHIVYEKCSVCYGVFFDPGEFRDYQETTVAEFLKGLVS